MTSDLGKTIDLGTRNFSELQMRVKSAPSPDSSNARFCAAVVGVILAGALSSVMDVAARGNKVMPIAEFEDSAIAGELPSILELTSGKCKGARGGEFTLGGNKPS